MSRAVALGTFTFALLTPMSAAVDPGQKAPDFAFTDLTGQSHRLSDYQGKIIVLEWLNPACPYVLRHYKSGTLPGLQKAAAADGLIWLQINSNTMGDLDAGTTREWQKKQGIVATAYVRDQSGAIGRAYGAEKTPHVFVIAADGLLAYRGAIDDQPSGSIATAAEAHNYVQAALAALKKGQPVATPSTPPYGCAVKYSGEP